MNVDVGQMNMISSGENKEMKPCKNNFQQFKKLKFYLAAFIFCLNSHYQINHNFCLLLISLATKIS